MKSKKKEINLTTTTTSSPCRPLTQHTLIFMYIYFYSYIYYKMSQRLPAPTYGTNAFRHYMHCACFVKHAVQPTAAAITYRIVQTNERTKWA